MNRRQVLAGAAAVAALPVVAATQIETEVHPEKGKTYKDLYWDAQAHIDSLELDLSEMRAHAMIMKKNASVV